MSARFYDMDGNPTTIGDWAARTDGFEETFRVAKDTVGEADVSTVLLGLDHSHGSGPPLIFESMIFGGDHDCAQWRYATREAAEDGHRRIVEALAKGETPPETLPIGEPA
jgi:hypothetical protein